MYQKLQQKIIQQIGTLSKKQLLLLQDYMGTNPLIQISDGLKVIAFNSQILTYTQLVLISQFIENLCTKK